MGEKRKSGNLSQYLIAPAHPVREPAREEDADTTADPHRITPLARPICYGVNANGDDIRNLLQ
jgi:hypothetical protein